jgi:hypothetical protein
MPSARYRRDRLPEWVRHLRTAGERIERDLESAAVGSVSGSASGS